MLLAKFLQSVSTAVRQQQGSAFVWPRLVPLATVLKMHSATAGMNRRVHNPESRNARPNVPRKRHQLRKEHRPWGHRTLLILAAISLQGREGHTMVLEDVGGDGQGDGDGDGERECIFGEGGMNAAPDIILSILIVLIITAWSSAPPTGASTGL